MEEVLDEMLPISPFNFESLVTFGCYECNEKESKLICRYLMETALKNNLVTDYVWEGVRRIKEMQMKRRVAEYSGRPLEMQKKEQEISVQEKVLKREEWLRFLDPIKRLFVQEWHDNFEKRWTLILKLPTVEKRMKEVGKQQNTKFNRKLLAQIIHYVGHTRKAMLGYRATTITRLLGFKTQSSIRTDLGIDPDKEIIEELVRLNFLKKEG